MAEPQVFIAVFEEAIVPEVIEKVEASSMTDDVYQLSDEVLLVRADFDDPKSLSGLLKLSRDGDAGVVFKLNGSYSGYHDKTLWSWLRESR